MKPTEQRLLFYYIKGLEGRRIHEYLFMKRLSKLEEAMEYTENTYKEFSCYGA